MSAAFLELQAARAQSSGNFQVTLIPHVVVPLFPGKGAKPYSSSRAQENVNRAIGVRANCTPAPCGQTRRPAKKRLLVISLIFVMTSTRISAGCQYTRDGAFDICGPCNTCDETLLYEYSYSYTGTALQGYCTGVPYRYRTGSSMMMLECLMMVGAGPACVAGQGCSWAAGLVGAREVTGDVRGRGSPWAHPGLTQITPQATVINPAGRPGSFHAFPADFYCTRINSAGALLATRLLIQGM